MNKNSKGQVIVMVTIRLAGWWAGLAGRIGGSTIYAGRTGLILRNMHRGRNPRTANQLGVRANFRTNTSGWRLLTDPQLLAWNAAAKLNSKKNKVGTSYTGTGAAFYSAVNDTAGYVNTAFNLTTPGTLVTVPIVDPPTMAPANNLGNIDTLVASNAGGTQTLTVDIPIINTGNVMILEATPQMSNGRSFFKGTFRPIKLFPAHAALTAESVLAAYHAVFGNLIAGKRMAMRARIYNLTGNSPNKQYMGVELVVKVAAV